MGKFDPILRGLRKLKNLRKLKKLRSATKSKPISSELAKMEHGLRTIETKAITNTGLAKIPAKTVMRPGRAGVISAVSTSRVAKQVEKSLLNKGTRKFPKWLGGAKSAEDAVIKEASKTGRFGNLLKRGGKFGLEVAAWGVAGYYFDRAIDYIFGGDNDGGGDDPNNPDKGGLSSKDAYDLAQVLSDNVHGLVDGWPIGLVKNFDLSRDSEFMQIFSDFTEAVLRPNLKDEAFAGVRLTSGYSRMNTSLMIHRVCESLKTMAALTDHSSVLRLQAVQTLLSDDLVVVPPAGIESLTSNRHYQDVAESFAEGHLSNISNFVDEYRSTIIKDAYDDMTDFFELSENKRDLVAELIDPTNEDNKMGIMLIGSYSNDSFEDTMGMVRSFAVDDDGDDDESAMLNYIASNKQRSNEAIRILNNTL